YASMTLCVNEITEAPAHINSHITSQREHHLVGSTSLVSTSNMTRFPGWITAMQKTVNLRIPPESLTPCVWTHFPIFNLSNNISIRCLTSFLLPPLIFPIVETA